MPKRKRVQREHTEDWQRIQQYTLGHQSPATTQHYVSTSPTKLAQAYKDAGYFARNVRAIEG